MLEGARAGFLGRLSAAALAAVLATSCDRDRAAPTEPPETPWRRYALTHVNDENIPVFRGVSGTDTLFIAAETLSLLNKGRVADAMYSTTRAAGTATTQGLTLFTTFTLFGDSIQIGTPVVCAIAPCPSFVRRGTLSDSAMVIRYEGLYEYRFARVPPP